MNTQEKLQIILSAVIGAAAVAGCAFFHPAAGIVAAAACLIYAAIAAFFRAKRHDTIRQLCDDTSRILRGAEQISLNSFDEGELSILASEIRKMTVQIREQNRALQQEKTFLKEAMEDMSHQLRTPLTSMMLLIEIMRSPELSRQQTAETLQEMLALLTRMQWLIETLLNLSRLDAGAVSLRTDEIRCSTLIRDALEPISVALELKDISTEIRNPDDPALKGDLPYLTEAIGNILKNCMEHTPEGGQITISVTDNAIYTGICITDSGAGIAQEDLPHIFERFYRGSEFSKNGYGIGLSYARKIVTAMHGSLQCRNAEPHGAQFDLRMYKTVV